MTKFKYHQMNAYHHDNTDEKLDQLGADGWDLVSACTLPNNMVRYVFKREFTQDEYADAGDLGWRPA